MAYKELGEVEVIVLGGINKHTGKRNPTQLEGYYLGSEDRPNKFNKHVPQKFYKFQTEQGDVGIYGKAGIDKSMKGAALGAMTKIVDTGETLDTGKGNPMRVFKVYQDKTNTIDISDSNSAMSFSSSSSYIEQEDTYAESALDSDEDSSLDAVPPVRATAPSSPASTTNAAQKARVEALLNKNRPRSV